MEKIPCLTLNRHAETRLKRRHPWIFSNEIADPKLMKRVGPGALVEVLDCHGNYVGTGFLNPNSLIAVRILSRSREQSIDISFFTQQIQAAFLLRESVYGKKSPYLSTYRAVFGESDGLPGLIVDRYQGAWVVEAHSLGMHMRKEELFSALRTLRDRFEPGAALVYRTDHRSAGLEGITQEDAQVVDGKIPTQGVFAVEDGIYFGVDPLGGQKTGFFFDQRENRAFFRNWIERTGGGQKVLDVFCHAGAWGLRALKAGAEHVTFVDRSPEALEIVKNSVDKNGWKSRAEFVTGDALEFLRASGKKNFQAIALDPPALVPNKKSLPAGVKHYRDLNAAAMKWMGKGAVLSTSSCSFHMEEAKFEETVQRAALDAEWNGRILARGQMALDHPGLLGMSEGRYLKNLFLCS